MPVIKNAVKTARWFTVRGLVIILAAHFQLRNRMFSVTTLHNNGYDSSQ